MRALFPEDATRRAFLRTVGASTALAAVSHFLPIGAATDAFAQGGTIEKKDLKVGFIPITCATPIIMAAPMGFYEKQGLNVEVVKTAGWAVIRDKTLNKEYDAAHMLSPMPLAISLGAGSNPMPYTMPAVENINGQAITLAMKHKDKRDPKHWKGFKLAVPFDYSMHNYLLRYYLAEHGVDPDTDVQIRAVPPPEMVANLRADNIDGFLAPDPVNQRAVYDGVGFIHLLSKEIWDRHPCCAFAASREFVTRMPNTYARAAQGDHRGDRLRLEAGEPQADRRGDRAGELPQPAGDGGRAGADRHLRGRAGQVRRVPDRIDFDPFPWESFAVWMMTQMKRWGQIKGDVDYKAVAKQVYLATDAAKLMKEAGLTPPAATSKTFVVMGKTFDPDKPDEYLAVLRHQAVDLSHDAPRFRCGRASSRSCSSSPSSLSGTSRRSGSGPAQPMDPEYAKLMGATATAGQIGDAGPARRGGDDLGPPQGPLLRQGRQRQGHRHPARLFGRPRRAWAICWRSSWRSRSAS